MLSGSVEKAASRNLLVWSKCLCQEALGGERKTNIAYLYYYLRTYLTYLLRCVL